jgi:serine/threonine protein phosphatase PrpC
MELEVSVISKPGGRPVNEDACGLWATPGAFFVVVSDGAGGHGGGDVASKLVVREALAWFRERPRCEREQIAKAIEAANEALVEAQRQEARLADMRATAVVLAVDTERNLAIWGNIGDSRLYWFRDGKMVARTRDHSVLQRMVDAGYLKPEALRTAPGRNQLFAAVGDDTQLEAHVEEMPLAVQAGDAFLLCTDGCWEHIEESDILVDLQEAASPEQWLSNLEARILAHRTNGQDNYAAVGIWCA